MKEVLCLHLHLNLLLQCIARLLVTSLCGGLPSSHVSNLVSITTQCSVTNNSNVSDECTSVAEHVSMVNLHNFGEFNCKYGPNLPMMRILPWKPTDLEKPIQNLKIPTFLFLSICNDKEQSALGVQ